jgi:hypothetical protein
MPQALLACQGCSERRFSHARIRCGGHTSEESPRRRPRPERRQERRPQRRQGALGRCVARGAAGDRPQGSTRTLEEKEGARRMSPGARRVRHRRLSATGKSRTPAAAVARDPNRGVPLRVVSVATGEVLKLLDNETGMHSCLEPNPSVAGWHRRQEEASPCPREYRHRSGRARSLRSC